MAKRATCGHPDRCYSEFRSPQASRHRVRSFIITANNSVPGQCHAVPVFRLHFPETRATPHNFRRQPPPPSPSSLSHVSLRLAVTMDRASVQDVSPARGEGFGSRSYTVSRKLAHAIPSVGRALLPAAGGALAGIPGRTPFSPPGPVADYISQKLARTQGIPFFCLRDPRRPEKGKCAGSGLGPC